MKYLIAIPNGILVETKGNIIVCWRQGLARPIKYRMAISPGLKVGVVSGQIVIEDPANTQATRAGRYLRRLQMGFRKITRSRR
jgi:hypothetical protein